MNPALLNQPGIYEILNTVNGKKYIGQSQNMKKRWVSHRGCLRRGEHHAAPLQNAWNKYGEGAFKFRVILTCAVSMLDFYEQQLLDKAAPEYNICPIAESTRGRKLTAEHKSNIAAAHIAHWETQPRQTPEEARKKKTTYQREQRAAKRAAAPVRDGKRSPEFRAAVSARMKGNTILLGRKLPPEWCAAISAGRKGAKLTDAQRDVLSEAHIGIRRSVESCEKQSKTMKGKPKSPEHCANISKGKKGKTFPPHTQEHKDKIAATLRVTLAAKRATKEALIGS